MKVCSIVVLYEPKEKEIEHIWDYFDSVDIVFVMDNSKLTNKKIVNEVITEKKLYEREKLVYIHFPENIGLCKAFNIGMKMAKKENCEWALLMDSDSSFITNIINVYQSFLKDNKKDDIAVLAPIHIFDRSNNKGYNGNKRTKWAMTSGCLYNINIFEKLNGFKEELYIDGLDMDYCHKANVNQYKIIEFGKAQLQHFPGETREVRLGNKVLFKYGYASPWRYYMQARALIWMTLRYKSLIDLAKYFYKWLKVIFLFDHKVLFARQICKGTKEGIALWRNRSEK